VYGNNAAVRGGLHAAPGTHCAHSTLQRKTTWLLHHEPRMWWNISLGIAMYMSSLTVANENLSAVKPGH
jgi:hypothetical protein